MSLEMSHRIVAYSLKYTSKEEAEAFSALRLNRNVQGFDKEKENSGVNPEARQELCIKCKKYSFQCPGHGIYVPIQSAMINPNALVIIRKLAMLFCFDCGSPYAAWEYYPGSGFQRFLEIAEKKIEIECSNPNCEGRTDLKINKSKVYDMFKNGTKQIMPEEIREFLKKIPERYYKIFAMEKGSVINSIMSFIYIMPLCMLPRGFANGQTRESPLWTTLRTLHGFACEKNPKIVKFYYDSIVKTIAATQTTQVEPHNVRMNTKLGFIRYTATTRRICNITRAVLNPGSMSFGKIRIPRESKMLEIKERVTAYNFDSIIEAREAGEIKRIWAPSSDYPQWLHYTSKISIGDIVLRQLREGDTVLFCRQPVLHSHSIVAYTVEFSDGNTIEIHSSNTTPHNADFDGDEGNIHVVPSTRGRVELEILAHTTQIVIGPQSSSPMMGVVFNGISGGYLLSVSKNMNVKLYEELKTKIKNPYTKKFSKIEYNGKELISYLFPPTFNYTGKNKDPEKRVKIVNGIFVSGILDKGELAETRNGIVHKLVIRYNTNVASRFISDAQFLFVECLVHYGLSLSFKNYEMNLLPDDWEERVKKVDKIVRKIEKIREKTTVGERQHYDEIIKSHINGLLLYPKTQLDAADTNLELIILAKLSRARGDPGNILSVVGLLGQQYSFGERLNDNRMYPRVTYYHEPHSKGIREHGFIDKAYINGLDPDHFWMACYDARVSLIIVQMNTPISGQKSREMVIHLTDLVTNEYSEVRGHESSLLMTTYGDGADPSCLSPVRTKKGIINTVFNVDEIIDELNTQYELDMDNS